MTLDALSDWLAEEALLNSDPVVLYGELCGRLRTLGVPLLRAQMAFRVLHPLYGASAITWTAGDGASASLFPPLGTNQRLVGSPFSHMLANRLPALRRRLAGDAAQIDFPMLEEFRDLGGTDYLAFMIVFDEGRQDGVICSWLSERASGFSDAEAALLERVNRQLAIPMKSRMERDVARNVAHAYLGRHAGEAVLKGSIRRGDGEKITAALWYSDLRQSTTLADRLSAEDFLGVLNGYFEMTAGAVIDGGGEVVSLIGDAVLGLFRVERSVEEACARALAAAQEARRRRDESAPGGTAAVDFGIALHLGEVIHGNVGVPQRLQFTVVGSAVNEVVRVQDLTKRLGDPLLATEAFAAATRAPWRPVGEHVLRGVESPLPIFAAA
ncbi:MAG: adenylate/guanylate cyclase domain-containing protein [Reyranellaceae bacterium]